MFIEILKTRNGRQAIFDTEKFEFVPVMTIL